MPVPDAEIFRRLQQHRIDEQIRIQRFGHIRSAVHLPDYAGYRFVGVRGRLYYSKKWNYFSDFLFEYGSSRFGAEWFQTQMRLTRDHQHPLHVMRREAIAYINSEPRLPDGSIRPNGIVIACNNFYYDLYTVDDNALLDEHLLARLKHRDQFQGAMHELFVQATCLRAGFTIIPENERDPSRRHAEFVAVHRMSGQHVSVEAKARHRSGVLGRPGVLNPDADIRFRRLINDAVAKDPANPLALFVDTNLPERRAKQFYEPRQVDPTLPSLAFEKLVLKVREEHDGRDPYNLIVFTNHPQHYHDDREVPANRIAASIPEVPRVKVIRKDALHALLVAARLYGNVPTHFPPDRN